MTGDLGHFDEDGFLMIEGRLTRFSKIGGEMVPHGTVEEKVVELFGLEQGDGPAVVVVGVPDPAKGEALVAAGRFRPGSGGGASRCPGRRRACRTCGSPRSSARWKKIPVLGTGKTDLRACRELAQAAAEPAAEAAAPGGVGSFRGRRRGRAARSSSVNAGAGAGSVALHGSERPAAPWRRSALECRPKP